MNLIQAVKAFMLVNEEKNLNKVKNKCYKKWITNFRKRYQFRGFKI